MDRSRAEFDRFVADSTDTLLRAAFLIVWDLREAEDVVQETLLAVARRWPRVRRMEHPLAYARRILINRALRAAGRRAHARGELTGEEPPERADETAGPDAIHAHDELMRALAALPPRQRQERRLSWTRATRAGDASEQRDKEHRDMNDQLESDLRTVLQQRASLVPDSSVTRLSALDYRPRRSRLRPPIAIGASAMAAAAAGAAALVISLGAGATNAFAGWTPAPTPPAPGQIDAAAAACQASQSPVSGLPLKLADTRGPFTFSVYADAQSSATCFKGPSFTQQSASTSSEPISVPDGHIALSFAHPPARATQAYSFADGRTGAGVTGVALVLDDGTSVQATVGDGWFVAWWPGGQGIKAAQVTGSGGVVTQTFAPLPQIPGGAGGGSSNGSFSSDGSSGAGGATTGASRQSFSQSTSSPSP